MARKKTRAGRASPPKRPPTAVGTIPPAGPGIPFKSRLVCVTGGAGAGKSMLCAALARAWQVLRGRNAIVTTLAGLEKRLEELVEDSDVFVEVSRKDPGLAELVSRSSFTLWVVSLDSGESGFELGWAASFRAVRSSGAVGLVLNRTMRRDVSSREVKALLRQNDAEPLADLPYDDQASKGLPSESFARALSALMDELGRALGGPGPEETSAIALSKQLGVPYASRQNKILKTEGEQGLEGVIGERFARERSVLPLFIDGKVLAVALADPQDRALLDELRFITGYEIQPFVAARGQLRAAIEDFYSSTRAPRLDLDATAIDWVNGMLKEALAERASMIVLVCDSKAAGLRFEIDGAVCDRLPPPGPLFPAIVDRLRTLARLDVAGRGAQDGTISVKIENRVFELGVAILPIDGGAKVVLRVLDKGKGRG